MVVEEGFLAGETACFHGAVGTVRVLHGTEFAFGGVFVEAKLTDTCLIVSAELPVVGFITSLADFEVVALVAAGNL